MAKMTTTEKKAKVMAMLEAADNQLIWKTYDTIGQYFDEPEAGITLACQLVLRDSQGRRVALSGFSPANLSRQLASIKLAKFDEAEYRCLLKYTNLDYTAGRELIDCDFISLDEED